ncbi:MAG: hypothetical protein EA369_08115 [Bradymonadales bacterium]|nr:MAG: hypothetical protein EA369_08115 [Bradymonadales bacterium]
MKILHSLVMTLFVCAAFPLSNSFAQDEFEFVQVLDEPRYSLTKRFHFDLEISSLPLDAYYKPLMIELGASYQLSDSFSWEMARFSYPLFVHDTGLNRSVENLVNPLQEELDKTELYRGTTSKELKDIRYKVSSTLFLNLLYSKSNWFNQQIVYHFWQVGAGPFYSDMKHEKQYGVDLAARVRFFIDNRWMLNLRGGMGFGFNSKAPRQILFFSVGGGFAI